MPLEKTDIEIFSEFHDTVKDDLRKVIPATITAVHPERGTVDVVPAILNPLFNEFGSRTDEQLPSLSDVPLGIMRGGGFLIWLPIQKGDSVLVIFSDLSTDSWRSAAHGTGPVRPGFAGKHTPAGPFAIPCIAPDVSAPTQPASNPGSIIIGKDGSDEQIQISSSDIQLGRGASNFVSLSNLVAAAFTSLISELSAAILAASVPTPGGPAVPGDGGSAALSALSTAVGMLTAASTAATLVKAK